MKRYIRPINNPPQVEPLLTQKEVAAVTGFSVLFIKRARNEHDLPYYKIGKFVRIRLSEFEAWVKERKHVS